MSHWLVLGFSGASLVACLVALGYTIAGWEDARRLVKKLSAEREANG